ncbi:MAG: signal recognition particle-docking protein FtsY [Christensenellaceae bacterium]|nr:signal recognition particle-docking protein FtsY [Christensenellaceae bacterium]
MSFFEKLKAGMQKTRDNIQNKINMVLNSFTKVDEDLLEELEEALILCDVGVSTTEKLIERIRERIKEEGLKTADDVRSALKEELYELVRYDVEPETFPKVMLIVGVNGVGKTTSIGKIANQYKEDGKKVLIAAADTFRAAASEQLEIWAKRADVPIVMYGDGRNDPAAVVFDALDSAKHRGSDVVIIDTAGRLHNKKNLMNELAKISRVIDREYAHAQRETFIVLDGTTGQNALIQAKQFSEVVKIDGIILTKLDGTAKGGMVLAIKEEVGIPVRYIGVGEGINDLQPFNAKEFADSLF